VSVSGRGFTEPATFAVVDDDDDDDEAERRPCRFQTKESSDSLLLLALAMWLVVGDKEQDSFSMMAHVAVVGPVHDDDDDELKCNKISAMLAAVVVSASRQR
jgi:hypothetical protein